MADGPGLKSAPRRASVAGHRCHGSSGSINKDKYQLRPLKPFIPGTDSLSLESELVKMSWRRSAADSQPFAIAVSLRNRNGDQPWHRRTKPHYSCYVDKFRIFQPFFTFTGILQQHRVLGSPAFERGIEFASTPGGPPGARSFLVSHRRRAESMVGSKSSAPVLFEVLRPQDFKNAIR